MPSEFLGELLEQGVARVSYGIYWFCDQHEEEFRIEDARGDELSIPPFWREALLGMVHEKSLLAPYHSGWQTWDLERGILLSTGHTEDWNDAGYKLADPFEDVNLLFELASASLEQSPELFRHYLHHPEMLVRLAVAQNPNLTTELLEPMLCDLDSRVIDQLMRHRLALDLVARRKIMVRDLARASDPLELPRDLDSLSYSVWWTVRAAVAANPSTSSNTLLRLSQDPLKGVRLALCTHPNCPFHLKRDLLERFYQSEPLEDLLRYTLVPLEVLERYKGHAALEVAQHPCTPVEVLLELLGGIWTHWNDLKGVCTLHTDDPQAHAARRLGEDANQPFFEACIRARGPLTREEQLELSGSIWPRVRAELALNPELDPEVLQTLSLDSHPGVKEAALSKGKGPKPGRTLEEQWTLLEKGDFSYSAIDIFTFQEVPPEARDNPELYPHVHFQFNEKLYQLLDGRQLEPEIASQVWKRFGAPILSTLLELPSLPHDLHHEVTAWLEDYPAWREKLALPSVELEESLSSNDVQLAILKREYTNYFSSSSQELLPETPLTLEQLETQVDAVYQSAQSELERLHKQNHEDQPLEPEEELLLNPEQETSPTFPQLARPHWLEQATTQLLSWMENLDRSGDWSGWLERISGSEKVERLERNELHLGSTFREIPYDSVEGVIGAADTPERLLELTAHAQRDLVDAFLNHTHCTPAVLEALAQRLSFYEGFSEKLMNRQDLTPSSIWYLLRQDEGRRPLLELALQHPALTGARREAVLALLEAHLHDALPSQLSPEALDEMTQLGGWAAWHALEHPGVSEATIQSCLSSSDVDIALLAMRHSSVGYEQLLEWVWSNSKNRPCNYTLLPGQVLLEGVLGQIIEVWSEHEPSLDTDSNQTWTRALTVFVSWLEEELDKPEAPEALLMFAVAVLLHFISRIYFRAENSFAFSLARSFFSLERLQRTVTHPNMPERVLELLGMQFDSEYQTVRAWVASHPRLSDERASMLMRDPASAVLVALAQNPALSRANLERLSRDESAAVREAAIRQQ